jgi:uncharacterized protein YaiL (DUF2058 family)
VTLTDGDLVSLRDYVDTMFAEKEKALQAALLAQEKAVAAALMASDKAITKAEANAEKWRENANEWRGAMSDRDRQLPSRREVEAETAALKAEIKPLVEFMATQQGRSKGAVDVREAIFGVLLLLIAIAAFLSAHVH